MLLLMRSLALQPITTTSQLMAVVGMTMDKVGVVCCGSSVAVHVLLLDGCLALCCELSARGMPMAALLGESERVMEGLLKEVSMWTGGRVKGILRDVGTLHLGQWLCLQCFDHTW